ncbi:MAG: hypothetical protein ACLF0G_04145 [Candidatus Brocadiia bacterium]
MSLAREDRRFAVGLAVAVALVAVYYVAVEGALRAATRRRERDLRALQPKLQQYFGKAKAVPFERAREELAERASELAKRLAALRGAVEFDPGPLAPQGDGGGPSALYFALSRRLHGELKRQADLASAHVPLSFDPQGEDIQTPPADRVPRLHRQLVMAYTILTAAIEHRVAIDSLRHQLPERLSAPRRLTSRYLEEAAATVEARGSLEQVASFLHALSRPAMSTEGSRFLSIRRLEVSREPGEPEAVHYVITFAATHVDPEAELTAPAKDRAPGRGRPSRRRPVRF